MSYSAPVADMLFAMRELAGFDEVTALPGWSDLDGDVVRAVLDQANVFARDVLVPLQAAGDRAGARFEDGTVRMPDGYRDAYLAFVAAGWPTLAASTRYGGQGMPQLVASAVNEIWASANLAFSLCPLANENAAETLSQNAPEELKRRYLGHVVTGEWTAPMALTEPQAGSDLALLRCRAVPDAAVAGYRITGAKIFVTYGEHDLSDNVVHLVLARLPDAPAGTGGISLFLVPKFVAGADGGHGHRNDVQCISLERKLGLHASPTAVIAYGEREGAVGYLVGQPNRGLEAMFVMMNRMRLGVGVQAMAVAERAYQLARAYARVRVQGTLPGSRSGERVAIIRHPDVRRMLMNMKAQIAAMRALSYFAAARMDIASCHPDDSRRAEAADAVALLTPVIKGWQSEQAQELVANAVQIHGGSGFVEETGVAQLLRDVRVSTLYEATTGIQANDLVLRKIARDEGAAVAKLLAQMRRSRGDLAREGSEDLGVIGAGLERAERALEQSTRHLVEQVSSAPQGAAAGAVPYLMLLGTVAGGWQLGRAAVAAAVPADAGSDEPGARGARVITARFYAEHVLPRAHAYAQEVLSGAGSTLRLDEARF